MLKLTQYCTSDTEGHFVEEFHDDIQQCATYIGFFFFPILKIVAKNKIKIVYRVVATCQVLY